MKDRLVWLLNCFELRARIFQAGPLCRSSSYDAADGLGYIHVLKQGTLEVKTDAQPTLLLDEPSIIFYMNPLTHQLTPKGNSVELTCASFDFGAGMRNPVAQALPGVMVQKLDDMPALKATLDLLFYEAEGVFCGRQVVLDRLIEVVIVQLLRDLIERNKVQSGLLAGLAEPRLAKAINAMHEKPERSWTLQELASVAGMSRARFATKFRDIVGMTPGVYLTEWRIGVAQSLLRRGKPVQLIADAVGYGSASALSRIFTSMVGISPTEWKKQFDG